MRKLIYFLCIFLFTTNLKAVEEIELQWEDITPPAGFTPRYLQQDDNDNMYGLLGNRIFFYDYATNNWTTQNLPSEVEINKVIDFDVDENGKAYFVIEGSSQFLIYDLNSKDISYLDLPKVDGYQYYYTFKIINKKLFFSILDENYNTRLAHFDINSNSIQQIEFNTLRTGFKYERINKTIIANQQNLFTYPYNFEYNIINYNKLGGFNIERKYIGQTKDNIIYINNAINNDENTIILYKTPDLGNNWELVIDPQTNATNIYDVLFHTLNEQFVILIGNRYVALEEKDIMISLYDLTNNKFYLSKVSEFGNQDIIDIAYSWGTENLSVPIDQNIYITKNNELIVYSQERMLKTDLKKITSVENETTPLLKNLSVLYGNISENILNINIESGISSNAKVSLYSSDMREIEQFSNVDFMQGKNELTFNINTTLSTGAYYVFIESGNYKHFYRIIKD